MTAKQAEVPPKILDIILAAAKKRWPELNEPKLCYLHTKGRTLEIVFPIRPMSEDEFLKAYDDPDYPDSSLLEKEEISLNFRFDFPENNLTCFLGYGPRSNSLIISFESWPPGI